MSAVREAVSNVTPLRPVQSVEQVWLSPSQVCERVPGMTPRHLQYLRDQGRGPRYFKPTRKTVLYAAADVDAWVSASAVTTRDVS